MCLFTPYLQQNFVFVFISQRDYWLFKSICIAIVSSNSFPWYLNDILIYFDIKNTESSGFVCEYNNNINKITPLLPAFDYSHVKHEKPQKKAALISEYTKWAAFK